VVHQIFIIDVSAALFKCYACIWDGGELEESFHHWCSVTATSHCTTSWNPVSTFSEQQLPQLKQQMQPKCYRTFGE